MSGVTESFRVAAQWVRKAENDLRNATHTLTLEDDCPFDTVCFHAHQCAEKYLKALLVARTADAPKTHDLRLLLQLVLSRVPLDLEIAQILPLNRYSVEARYPGNWEPITRADAEQPVSLAEEVRRAVREHLAPGVISQQQQ